jgi:SH3-like domain-containing protein
MGSRFPLLVAGAVALAAAAGAAEPQAPARGQVTSLPLPRFVSLRAETANVRRGPSLDQRVDWEFVHRGMPLEITAEHGQWRRVRDAEGATGWVHHTLLSGVRTVLVRGAAPVALHAGPDGATPVRAMAEPGAIGRLEACEGGWCEIASGGIEGWLPREAIWGVGPEEEVE